VRSVSPSITDAMAEIFNWKNGISGVSISTKGQFEGTWQDFPTLFSDFASQSVTLSDDDKNNFRKWFVLYAQEDKEAFWVDLNNDKVVQKNSSVPADFELFQRFNIKRFTDANSNGDYDTGETNLWDTSTQTESENFINRTILMDYSSPADGEPDGVDTNGDNAADVSMLKWGSTLPDGSGIPWLALFGMKKSGTQTIGSVTYDNYVNDDTLKGTFASVADRRRQIAANLKDYCDSDSIPTSDIDPASWFVPATSTWCATDPKYTGNELSPYLNEVGVRATVFATNNGAGVDKTTVTLDISIAAEICNIYPQLKAFSNTYEVYVKGSYDYHLYTYAAGKTPGTALPASRPQPFTCKIEINSANWTGTKYGNAETTIVDPIVAKAECDKKGAAIRAYDVNVTIEKVCLVYNGKLLDYASFSSGNQSIGTWTFFYDYIAVADITRNLYASWQTKDCRQNLNSDDWILTVTTSNGTDASTSQAQVPDGAVSNWTTGVVNNISGASPSGSGKDPETVTDPGDKLSTAYIANRPMISPWELGFIHRGVAWETINLKAYDKSKAVKPVVVNGGTKIFLAGGGAYADGDANILDQIKMTSNTSSSKKINLKAHSDEVFKALFNKIYLGATPVPPASPPDDMSKEAMAQTGTVLNATDGITVGGSNLFERIREKGINFNTRAALAEVTEMSSGAVDGISRLTDATQEELIGKVINLTEVGGKIEYFTVIVLAQAIRDVGTPQSGSGVTISKYDKNGDFRSITGCKLGQFDFNFGSDKYDFKTYVYGDDIVGEQKIKVRGYRVSGNVKILSYEYVE
jgi:hypothetical protein